MVTRLALPSHTFCDSWAAAVAEFDGIAGMDGSGLWQLPHDEPLDTTEEGCRRVVALLADLADTAADLPNGVVPADHYWIVDGEAGETGEVVGFLALRHRLTDFLLQEGGHVGYSVRPSRRREGHATRALALALPRAAELGIEHVLVTCDVDNRASAATIEANGGVLEDVRGRERRYWIETGTSPDTADGTAHSGR